MTHSPLPREVGSLALVDGPDGRRLEIPCVEQMPPFLVSVLSSTDLWMFVASNGGLTAGRISAEHSLFPYETVDRLYERPGRGGPLTLIRVGDQIWWPFDPNAADPAIVRRLTKSELSDQVGFEEVHEALGLGFRYTWIPSERFGWVRTAQLWTLRSTTTTVEILDGLLDLLPAGVPLSTQQRASTLIDAYRHTELHEGGANLAIYSLSSLLTDRAEPAEALRANVIWRIGLPGRTHLSPDSVNRWRRRRPLVPSPHLRGKKGAYLVETIVSVEPGVTTEWSMIGDVSLDGSKMAALRADLQQPDLPQRLNDSIRDSRVGLERLVAAIDGRQCTADALVVANHLSNALFNGFRGGVLIHEGRIPAEELLAFLRLRNRSVAEHHLAWIQEQPGFIDISSLREVAAKVSDPNLERLVDETMPLAYGRRHGDPSRPWNRFSIRTRTDDGKQAIHYEGNWRDIFQNWEALAISFPEYLPSMIAKFVNAWTVDGYNPYRISRTGIDWEIPDPEDPWSNIGYWGDHQIIYLLRLLEALHRYRPELLEQMLDARKFSFADIPYRICPFVEILKNPRDTIRFDYDHEEKIQERVAQVGEDGRLVWRGPEVAHTHLWEKLLIPLLSKLSNLVLDGGIWMNTQRPEWNDANNALPGYGLSVVTLAHTLRYARFLRELLADRSDPITLAPIVRRWFEGVGRILAERAPNADVASPTERWDCMNRLGQLFSEYRESAYQGWPSATISTSPREFGDFLGNAASVLERAFRNNRRADGLFHSYNTMSYGKGEVFIERLTIMLEGQVAALDAQVLSAQESVSLIDAMYDSPLYREDLDTFLLYPDKVLPDFESRNRIAAERAQEIQAVRQWLVDGETRIMCADLTGTVHFHADLKNAAVLQDKLDALEAAPDWQAISDHDRAALLDLYEETFRHAEFTGRSASMYGYEGLGCVYWHMVAKLLVAVQETFVRALDNGENATPVAAAYDRVRAGFGFNKTPAEYGAFPTDAYSHSPGHSGAQQPGMTGQVKEQMLTRFGELGVRIKRGSLCFEPTLLKKTELLATPADWKWTGSQGEARLEHIPSGGLAFTVAGVPIIYRTDRAGNGAPTECLEIFREDGTSIEVDGLAIGAELSREILGHKGTIRRIEVFLKPDRFN